MDHALVGLWPGLDAHAHGDVADRDSQSTDRNGLTILTREECLRLLGEATLGRVGISVGAMPVILPINFRLIGDRIVFRTGTGTKLEAATRRTVIAFEVDDMDLISHTGWSVVVVGPTREVTDPVALAVLAHAGIPRWAPAGDERVVELDTVMVSGRRIGPSGPGRTP
jgi:nitroimidazol reductase NimA-like FMN-containing flavoprotein (pyridoxamine 5'-phosphate oxidase superfamily)